MEIAIALIVASVALVVLLVVAASGIGPVSSLRRTVGRFEEVTDEAERLRRNVEVLGERRARVERRRSGEGPPP